MTSKFSIKSYLPLICFLGLVSLLIFYITNTASNKSSIPSERIPLPIILLLTFTVAWLFFGELRTKMIIVKLENDHLTIRKFGGIAPNKKIFYSELDGFKTSILKSRGGENEYLYLMQGDKKVAKLSDFYHKNYSTLKNEIQPKLKDLGFEKFSYWDELKETFT